MTQTATADLFPYTDADFEAIPATELRAGHMIGGRGPVGSHRWLAVRVAWAGLFAGFSGPCQAYLTDAQFADRADMPTIVLGETVMVLRQR